MATPLPDSIGKIRTEGEAPVTYIRNSLTFELLSQASITGTEVLTIRVRMGRKKWVKLTNIYCPPMRSHTRSRSIALTALPTSPDSLIMGDFNAHNRLWDDLQPEDSRGNAILDWCLAHDLAILNDGSQTRDNTRASSDKPTPASGGKSSPDLTICGPSWNQRCSWTTTNPIGSSDHLPILTTVNQKVQHLPIFKGIPRWKTVGVDWEAYMTYLEDTMPKAPQQDVHLLSSFLEQGIIEAATKFVGTTIPGKSKKPWINPAVREAIRSRNKLRKNLPQDRKAWLEACKATRTLIQEAKTSEWRKTLDEVSVSHDDTKLWRTLKGLKGIPDQSPNEAMTHNGRVVTSNHAKANIFMSHYSRIGRLSFSQEERRLNREAKAAIKRCHPKTPSDLSPQHNPPPPFTLTELKLAIANLKPREAPGPDNISPSLL